MKVFYCPRGMLVLLATGLAMPGAADQILFDFSKGLDKSLASPVDARFSLERQAGQQVLRVRTAHQQRWPGLLLRAPSAQWDLSGFAAVSVELRNAGSRQTTISCRVDDSRRQGLSHCVYDGLSLAPGESGVLNVELRRDSGITDGVTLFGMQTFPGGPIKTIDPAHVTQVFLFVTEPTVDNVFDVKSVRAVGSAAPLKRAADHEPFLPFIDTFGQYMHSDWSGKTHTLQDLTTRRSAEEQELASHPPPADRDGYGGWADGPRLPKTGFFRVEKWDGRWWFVDPDGHLFWSHGVEAVQLSDWTPVEERKTWFNNFPGDQPAFKQFLKPSVRALKGHFAGRLPLCFSFSAANLLRKFGQEWKSSYPDFVLRRRLSWGLTTFGTGTATNFIVPRKTVYTDIVTTRDAPTIQGSEGYWRAFPDVFDPRFVSTFRAAMGRKKGISAGDPWCLGFFCDNELGWGSETYLAEATLRSPPGQAAKKAFVEDLRNRYGDIGKLNAAWGTEHASWAELLQSIKTPAASKAEGDLKEFATRIAEHYFQVTRDIIHEVAPQQLYLGCRFSHVNPIAATAAARFCDVLSYNLYIRSVARFRVDGNPDRPVLVSEFHFGARDRGPFDGGAVEVENQQARGRAYQSFVEGALRHPQIIGTHWFAWRDFPTTGYVYTEDNFQAGLTDQVDSPYPETIAALREIGKTMYTIRSGSSH